MEAGRPETPHWAGQTFALVPWSWEHGHTPVSASLTSPTLNWSALISAQLSEAKAETYECPWSQELQRPHQLYNESNFSLKISERPWSWPQKRKWGLSVCADTEECRSLFTKIVLLQNGCVSRELWKTFRFSCMLSAYLDIFFFFFTNMLQLTIFLHKDCWIF